MIDDDDTNARYSLMIHAELVRLSFESRAVKVEMLAYINDGPRPITLGIEMPVWHGLDQRSKCARR